VARDLTFAHAEPARRIQKPGIYFKGNVMEDKPGILNFIESIDQVEHCPECGRPWVHDEPTHYADCRYFFTGAEIEEEFDEEMEVAGWRSFDPHLL
jgi:hypothetical protein